MNCRPLGRVLGMFCVIALLCAANAVQATAPVMTYAVSRKFHNLPVGGLTPFDVPLTLSNGAMAIECRIMTGASGLIIVMNFDQPVVASTSPATTVTLTSTTGATGMTAAAPVFSGSTVSVTLSGLADQNAYSITVRNIVSQADSTGVLASAQASFRTLIGDVDASGAVVAGDIAAVKSNVGQAVTTGNFRADLNANGSISAGDVLIPRIQAGKLANPPGPWVDTAPTIATIATQAATSGVTTVPIGFTVGDTESDPSLLYVYALTNNPTLLPSSNILLAGTGASRTITVTPVAGQVGTAQVTLAVSDGIKSNFNTFNVTVTSPSTLYVATLAREDATVATTGTGTATLLVNAAGTQAVLRFQYANLTSPKVSQHLHHAAPGVVGPIIYDIDMATTVYAGHPVSDLQPDGSYVWTFDQSPTANPTAAQIVSEIAAGNYYINIHTAEYPGGEIRGQFNYAAGSQTFTPPAAPAAQPQALPTANDVSRFLQQATFGPSLGDLNSTLSVVTANSLSNGNTNAYDAWLTSQFALPATSVYGDPTNAADPLWTYQSRLKNEVTSQSSDRVVEAWWRNAIVAPDQLRQRVAFAYSQIFVVSSVDTNLDGQSPALANYHDMLAADAFVNFRQILNDVTLNPMMGQYLSMRGNNKQTKPAMPNENYAREIMQLFSIGLNVLQPDGTLKLDASGLPIPSYDQTVIEGFAQVFTGYDLSVTNASLPAADKLLQYLTAGTAPDPLAPFYNNYHQPMAPTSSGANHSSYEKDLLSPTGNYAYAVTDPLSDRYYIPATGTQTTASTNNDLKLALDNIFSHPNVGPFISRQLIQRLVGSTPSPAYVYRVAQVFNNNGSGVRGDMQAVIKAILTDYEARSPQTDTYPLTGNLGYGHLREPVLRISGAIRALHPSSTTGYYKVSPTDTLLGQTAYRATTVFNFYTPNYSDPGVVAAHNLQSPELYLATENTNVNYLNLVYAGVYNTGVSTSGFSYGTNWPGNDVFTNLDCPEGFRILNTYTVAGSNLAYLLGYAGVATSQTVIGNGIPPLTTVSTITPVVGVTISSAALSTNTGITLTFGGTQVVTGCSTIAGSKLVILPAGTLAPAAFGGIADSASNTIIPLGATVSTVYVGAAKLTLSASAVATNTSGAPMLYGTQVVSANTTLASNQVVVNGSTAGLAVGQAVAGQGIPILSFITAISGQNLTISQNATATASAINLIYSVLPSESHLADDAAGVGQSPPTGAPAGGSALSQLGLVDRLDLQLTGGALSRGIPTVPGTIPPTLMTNPAKARIITYVNSLARVTSPTTVTLTLSQNATGANTTLTINGTAVSGCVTSNGSNSATVPIGTANLAIGQTVTAANIPANTVVANIVSTNVANGNDLARARAAANLILSSSQYSTQK